MIMLALVLIELMWRNIMAFITLEKIFHGAESYVKYVWHMEGSSKCFWKNFAPAKILYNKFEISIINKNSIAFITIGYQVIFLEIYVTNHCFLISSNIRGTNIWFLWCVYVCFSLVLLDYYKWIFALCVLLVRMISQYWQQLVIAVTFSQVFYYTYNFEILTC